MTTPPHPLDDPVRAALTGPHAHFAERDGDVLRYPSDVAPFLSLPDPPGPADWAAAAASAEPGAIALMVGADEVSVPDDWEVVARIAGVQMSAGGLTGVRDDEAVPLTAADVPEMLDLVERTQPGPFLARTVEMGTYLGVRREGRLVAMAGERLRVPGWTEISAVCTDPAFRGQGLAGRLMLAVAAGIQARTDTPFLHAAATNTNAIRLYETLGFRLRRTVVFSVARVPDRVTA